MAKIRFDIKYRDKIESGEYKVCINYDWPVEILSWDCIHVNRKGKHFPILAKITCLNPGEENDFIHWYNNEGKYDPWDYISSAIQDNDCVAYCPGHDLFLVTPEQELSEFEEAYMRIVHKMKPEEFNDEGLKTAKENAAELLALSREQFIKDGYIIEKKAFHDAVENIDDKHQAEMSVQYSLHCKVQDGTRHAIMNWDAFQKVAQKFIDIGKAEALKDLPRWKMIKAFDKLPCRAYLYNLAYERENNYCGRTTIHGLLIPNEAVKVGCDTWYLPVDDIQNLPKEDSHE